MKTGEDRELVFKVIQIILIVIVIGAFLILLTSCQASDTVNSDTQRVNQSDLTWDVDRFVDKEAGVVCWLYSKYDYGAGIDCMPIIDTLLTPSDY